MKDQYLNLTGTSSSGMGAILGSGREGEGGESEDGGDEVGVYVHDVMEAVNTCITGTAKGWLLPLPPPPP